ncbi:hypothetical protein D5278_07400 [bacterium 1XD21-13]|nr:hypothetical protein [bacterium 1XD21-13]
MKRNFQSLTAFTLSMALVIGSFMTVYATESEPQKPEDAALEQTSESEKEKNEETEEIVQVILPTTAVSIFDFILDPQELIRQTDAAAYGGKRFEEGATLFFERFDGTVEEDYSSDSDAVHITNRGDTPVDVEVKASVTVTMADGLAMTDDREFTDDTRASLYLALTDGETTVPISLEEGASIQVVLPAAVEDTEEDGKYSFWLTGASNGKGEWSELKDMEIQVTVTWNVVSREEEPVPENEEEIPEDVEKATPSTVPTENLATPSEAAPSDGDEENEEAPKATASEVDKDVSEEPSKATASDVDKKIKETTETKEIPPGKDQAAEKIISE